jgi:phytoene dehydrogenase-like protein
MKTYDLVVIGSGTAAQVASARVRRAGRTVAVVDHRPFGGICALRVDLYLRPQDHGTGRFSRRTFL